MWFKISDEKKNNLKQRWKGTGIIIAFAIILVLFGLFADPRHAKADGSDINGFAYYLPHWANAMFGCLFIASVMAFNIPVSIELDNCFIKSKSKRIIAYTFLILIVCQLLPTVLMLYSIYWGRNPQWLSLSTIIYFALFFINLIWVIPLYFISKKSGNGNKFNNIWFPIIVMVISFAFSGIYYLALVRGIFTLLLVIFICVFCDVGGLTFGIRFGKHKFATTISPKKSWEGVAGSFIFCYVVVIGLLVIMGLDKGQSTYQMQSNFLGNQWDWSVHSLIDPGQPCWYLLVVGFIFVMCIFSIGGDLLFSLFKRKNGIKDYSNLIKGHGGILDRIDSWVAVIAAFYVVTLMIGGISTIVSGWQDHDRIFNFYYLK